MRLQAVMNYEPLNRTSSSSSATARMAADGFKRQQSPRMQVRQSSPVESMTAPASKGFLGGAGSFLKPLGKALLAIGLIAGPVMAGVAIGAAMGPIALALGVGLGFLGMFVGIMLVTDTCHSFFFQD